MREERLDAAVSEAKRFIEKAAALKARRKKNDLYDFQGCRESGAAHRASIDLTRALADLRRPNQ